MKVLHIANYYIGAKVYKNLSGALDKIGVQQVIYTAFAGRHLVGSNKVDFFTNGSRLVYRPILNLYTRLNYVYKTKKITADIEPYIQNENFEIIHAHTLFSDGRTAFNLKKKYGIPYIVTIRNTDLNFFFKYFVHLRKQAKETLISAEKIIFISEAYRKRMFAHHYFADHKEEFFQKSIVIPNGIEDFWLKNIAAKHDLHIPSRLLFVGKFSKGKNLSKLCDIVLQLNRNGMKTILHVAGGGEGSVYNEILSKLKKHPEIFNYHGNISDKSALMDLYRASDLFVMPSKSETFGLVYVEALSQGIPVVFTKNEGIDGFFADTIGEAVDCNNDKDIYNKILKILNNYNHYSFNPADITSVFNWNLIAQKYLTIYKSANNKSQA